jgi:hypothetical protein
MSEREGAFVLGWVLGFGLLIGLSYLHAWLRR